MARYAASRVFDDGAVSEVLSRGDRPLERWLAIYRNSRQQDAPVQPQRTTITYAKLETIRVPTLLMPGDQDLQTPPWVMRRQRDHIPGASFIVLPEAAHAINWEKPEDFNRNVLEFISQYER